MLIFLVGLLAGVVGGGMLYVRYLRQEMAGEISPKLRRMQSQLDGIESALNLAIMTRYTEIAARSPDNPPRQSPS
jgi:hypothetical protein